MVKKGTNSQQGMLIVIDGIDGSGKATQTRLLQEYLLKEGHSVQTIDFPRYEDHFFGKLIGECLSGKRGDFLKTDPRIASVLYAADRFESKEVIEEWLRDGCIVLADRYVSANQIHQGGKCANDEEREEFTTWLDTMEHDIFQLPRPDCVMYLDVPHEVSVKWLQNKETQKRKVYLTEGVDLAENDKAHLARSRETAVKLAEKNDGWYKVQCCIDEQTCLSPEEVHTKVAAIVDGVLKNRQPM